LQGVWMCTESMATTRRNSLSTRVFPSLASKRPANYWPKNWAFVSLWTLSPSIPPWSRVRMGSVQRTGWTGLSCLVPSSTHRTVLCLQPRCTTGFYRHWDTPAHKILFYLPRRLRGTRREERSRISPGHPNLSNCLLISRKPRP